jgi:hypothetical protein
MSVSPSMITTGTPSNQAEGSSLNGKRGRTRIAPASSLGRVSSIAVAVMATWGYPMAIGGSVRVWPTNLAWIKPASTGARLVMSVVTGELRLLVIPEPVPRLLPLEPCDSTSGGLTPEEAGIFRPEKQCEILICQAIPFICNNRECLDRYHKCPYYFNKFLNKF